MALTIGQIVDGVVSNVMKFGAFIDLGEGKSGLVHISEISDKYVQNVSDVLEKGQNVKVKIISLDDHGKIALSIKQAQPKEETKKLREVKEVKFEKEQKGMTFEDKLSKFLKDSNEKLEQARSRENSKMSKGRSRK